jgi:DNA polymerase-3 subunit gamma/tau
MIAQLQPVTTQQLLRQQGCLVSIQGNMALVGIKSQPLLGIAKNKQSNIEAAFEKACQRPIRVSFQVGHEPTGEMDQTPAIAPPVQPIVPVQTPPPTPQPTYTQPEPFTPPAAQTPPTVPSPAPTPIRQPSPPAIVAPTPELNPVDADIADLEEPEPEGDRHQSITRQFAEFFAGEVIELKHFAPEELPAESPADSTVVNQAIAIPPEPQPVLVQGRPTTPPPPDEDIPF